MEKERMQGNLRNRAAASDPGHKAVSPLLEAGI